MKKTIEEMNILVIDDEEKICDLISTFLESSFSFKSIVTASNTMMASQKFVNQEFDLLIIDHILPGKRGIDFLEALKTNIKLNKMKVILISGYLQQEDVLKAMHLGVRNVVVKPFTRQQLTTHVAELLEIAPNIKKSY